MNWLDVIVIGLLLVDIVGWLGAWAHDSGLKKGELYVLKARVDALETQNEALRDDLDEHDEDLDDLGRDLTEVEHRLAHLDDEMGTVAECLELAGKMAEQSARRIKELDRVLQAHIECENVHLTDDAAWEGEFDDE